MTQQRKGETYPAYMARMDAEGQTARVVQSQEPGLVHLLSIVVLYLTVSIGVLWLLLQLVKWMW